MANSLGTLFRLTTFGESHGAAIGAVVDGCPAGVRFDLEMLRRDLARRRPGTALTSPRIEADEPEILSGVFEGITTGSPIAVLVRNNSQRSSDYDPLRDLYRPSHADYSYAMKYGHRDHRGGGRASARETVARVAGGAIARMILEPLINVEIRCAVTRIGPVMATRPVGRMTADRIYSSAVRCDDPRAERLMASHIEFLKNRNDSAGGVVSVQVDNLPTGLGEPIYDKLNARIAGSMMSINGATGIEFGSGFAAAERRGSENNDPFVRTTDGLTMETNNSGGVQGGISNGMPLAFRVAFKPPSSIGREQRHGSPEGSTIFHAISGRHDPTIVIRAAPVVEAMTLMVLADLWLMARAGATLVTASRDEPALRQSAPR